jgi:hypothetical protein
VSPALRRALLFLLMVAAGVAAVFLLSDPFAPRRGARVDELTGAEGRDGALRVVGAGEDEAEVVFGELDFDVTQPVEVAPGRVEDRTVARVHILSARSDPGGAFVAQGPSVRLLDAATGAERGQLRAREALFETGAAVAGSVTLDLGSLRAENWSLRGEVRGSFPLRDGRLATLACEELLVRGPLVRAPGRVTWTREDLALSGLDLTWDDVTGRLEYDADAHLSLQPAGARPGFELDAPGGLTFAIPPDATDARSSAYGELRGGVSGAATDGRRLAARTLVFEGRHGRLVLHDEALLARGAADGAAGQRLTARRITVEADDAGQLALAQADGDVRLVATPFAVVPGWMVSAPALTLEGQRAQAAGRVTFQKGALVAAGDGLAWDGAVGRLEFASAAELAVAEGGAQPLAGLRLVTPAGMSWLLPPGAAEGAFAASGRMDGPLTGTLPDGTSFGADLLLFDGPQRRLMLQGGASFRRASDAETSTLTAGRVTLDGDEHGRLAVVSADGDVLLLTGPLHVLPTRVVTESLTRAGALTRAPGRVTWTRGDVTVAGDGLTWDEDAGRLELSRDAHLVLVDPQRRLDLDLAAAGGLTWFVPASALVAADGHGELRGRVTGTSSDGSTLACDLLGLDGPTRTLTLAGAAEVRLADRAGRPPLELAGERLTLASHAEGAELRSTLPVRFGLGDVRGSGADLAWDGRSGALAVTRDLVLAATDPSSGAPLELRAGGLDWHVPPGATDPLRTGRGLLLGGVTLSGEGRRLSGERLACDGPGGRATLLGEATVARDGPGGFSLSAREALELGSDPLGEPRTLRARGGARGELLPADGSAPVRLSADELLLDRDARRAELSGQARLELDEAGGTSSLAARHLVVRTDELDALSWAQASGGVELRSGELVALTEHVEWDVADDHLVLDQGGRLLAAGAWMSFARAEAWPRASRFRILHGVVHVDP